MLYSTLTIKGQTTIPKEVRQFLGLSPEDKILYYLDLEKNQVSLIPTRGTVLDLRGCLSHKGGPIDFKELRERTKRGVAQRHGRAHHDAN